VIGFEPTNEDRIDETADRELKRFNLSELLMLTLATGLIFWLERSLDSQGEVILTLAPVVITTWVAVRLRYFPRVTLINPFSVGVLSATTAVSVSSYLSYGHRRPYGMTVTQIVADAMVMGVVLGLLTGLFAVMVADRIAAFLERWS